MRWVIYPYQLLFKPVIYIFMLQPDDAALYEKFDCPPLNLPFIDAQRRRLCFRNERSLYTRKCDATGQNIISIYSPDKPFKVYKSDYWYSDSWDALEYGQDFDFERTFFEQFARLQLKVPRLALLNVNAENSEYCNSTSGNKNCYLIFGGDYNEDCIYGTLCIHNTSCLDLDFSNDNNFCYELCDSINCYGCQFTFDSKNCTNCYFVSDCSGCTECILCTNLVQKFYCIENKQYSKEEYFEKKKEFIMGSFKESSQLFEKFLQIRTQRIVKFSHMMNCINSSGDYLKNSKNCINCFDVFDSEDLKNVIYAIKAKDCFECNMIGYKTELCFNTVSMVGAYNTKCSFFVIESSDVECSKCIISSKNIFGCVGLRHKQYCILNKQYSQTEYKNLRQRIIEHMKKTGEWGSFFPAKLSDFAYNETSAHDYFPLTKESAMIQGYLWKDEDPKIPQPSNIQVPDKISDVQNSLINEILQCEECQKNYKILTQELDFYKKAGIPIPRLCESCRHKRRMQMRNPRYLWLRNCQKCGVALQSSYSPDRLETIYCEKCYIQEVY